MVDGKRWYLTPSDEYYPSITSVLGIKPKQYLIDWRNALGAPKANKEMERTKARGEAMHLMAERYIQNDPEPTKGQIVEHIKRFNQIKIGLNCINNIRVQEGALYSDTFQVAGRVDCIADYEGVLSVIDYKSSNNNKKEDMIEDYFLQETFYALAYFEMTGEYVSQIVTLMAVERGIFPLCFKKPISPYVVPLQKRIDEFYDKMLSKA